MASGHVNRTIQAEHMAALTQACVREESPCQPGAGSTKRTCRGGSWMSALGGETDIRQLGRDVRV